MPLGLPSIGPLLAQQRVLPAVVQKAPDGVSQTEYPDGLIVKWHFKRVDVDEQTAEFRGGVEAIYGVTHIFADTLKVDYIHTTGLAQGEVRIEDPEGVIRGSEIQFNWKLKTGSVKDIFAQIDRIQLKADSMESTPGEIRFHNVYATPSKFKRPEIAARARDLVLRPGKSGTSYRPSIQMFGRWLGTVPYAKFTLDNRVAGFRLPAISFRRGQGLGVGWLSGFLLNENTSISANMAAFPKTLPSSNIALSYSMAPAVSGGGFIQPESELGIRFRQNYLDDIEVKSPASEEAYYQTKRRTLMLGSNYNQGTEGRIRDSKQVSKQLDLALEASGPVGGFGTYGQVRVQSIRDRTNASFQTRVLALGSLRSPNWDIAGLSSRARFDFLGSTGAGASFFGWGRLSAGAVKELNPHLRLGAEAYYARQVGTEAFLMDRLVSEKGLLFRGDLNLGPLKVSGLTKHDFNLGKGYDTEWTVAYACGSFEPFILVKQNPKTYSFGVRLRAQDIFDRLTNRAITRRKTQ